MTNSVHEQVDQDYIEAMASTIVGRVSCRVLIQTITSVNREVLHGTGHRNFREFFRQAMTP